MYHSSTTDIIKEDIKTDLSNPDGKIRLLIATSAADMVVNFAAIKEVINFGPPKETDVWTCRKKWRSSYVFINSVGN